MGGHLPNDPDADWEWGDPPNLEVEDTPNPVVAVLLGPDGDVISRLYERPRIAMGYIQGKEASRIERPQEAP